MNKTIFIYDKSDANSVDVGQFKTDTKVVFYEDTLSLQIDCIKHADDNLSVFINPNVPGQTGKPSVQNLILFLRAARPNLKIYFIFDTQKQLEFYQKNIVTNVTGLVTKPLDLSF